MYLKVCERCNDLLQYQLEQLFVSLYDTEDNRVVYAALTIFLVGAVMDGIFSLVVLSVGLRWKSI